jgi:hypothetical protein
LEPSGRHAALEMGLCDGIYSFSLKNHFSMMQMAGGTKMLPNEAILVTKTVMRTKNGTKSISSHDNLKIVMRTRKTV